jgi:hypothetical protein
LQGRPSDTGSGGEERRKNSAVLVAVVAALFAASSLLAHAWAGSARRDTISVMAMALSAAVLLAVLARME